jgi:chromosome segregation ATPase
MDFGTASKQAKLMKGHFRAFEHLEEVLNAAKGAVDARDRASNELVALQKRVAAARDEVEAAEVAAREAKAASDKRIKEIELGLNEKATAAGEKADGELTAIADRVTEALRGEEQATKDITERIRVLEQREAGVTASCNEAEDRLRRLQAELAKLS